MLRNGGSLLPKQATHLEMLVVIWHQSKQLTQRQNWLKGIVAYADISTAVNRWITTNSVRSELVSQSLEIGDLDKVIDGTKELRQTRITKDKDDLEKIKAVIKTTLDPFDEAVNENVLLSIRTGRALQRNGEEYLPTIKDEGEKRRDAFMHQMQAI